MLQSIRNNSQGIVAYFILGIMVLAMAAFGVGPLLDSIGGQPAAAEVNGDEIYEQAVAMDVERQKQQMYVNGVSDIDDAQVREQVLDRMINSKLIEIAAADMQLDVSKQVITQQIITNPAFAGPDGYDPQAFQIAISQQGYTPTSFRAALENSYVLQQYANGLGGTAITTAEEVAALIAVIEQKRSFEYGVINAGRYSDISVTEEQVAERYEAQKQQFLTDANITVDYVVVDRLELAKQVDITDEKLANEFALMQESADENSSKLVAHIMVNPTEDGSHEAKLAEIQAALAAGQSFGDVAAQYSEDFASAEYEGEIGETTGESFDPAIEDAVAELAVGQVSDVVESEFGFHILTVVSEDSAAELVYEDVVDQLEERVRLLEVEQMFAAEVEGLREAAYQYGDMTALADALGYELHTSEQFTKARGKGVFSSAQARDMAFSAEVRQDELISELVEIDENRAIVMAKKAFNPARILDLEEVKGLIEHELEGELATAKAKDVADSIVAKATSGETLEQLFSQEKIDWLVASDVNRSSQSVDPLVLDAAFKTAAPESGKHYTSHVLADGTVLVLGLKPATDGLASAMPAPQLESMRSSLTGLAQAAEFEALQLHLKANADIERN